ncbi:MAG: holo-ACP synthase [Phycisphaerales bacterium]|nr:holo-ACP synthase [Phycisphaerales bacterium]
MNTGTRAIIGHGVDIVEIARIEKSLAKHADSFLSKCFTEREVLDSGETKRKPEHLAARFAAKEAALKAIGTGWSQGIAWTDVETVRLDSGKPELRVTGRAKEIADSMGVDRWFVSLSHTETNAIASVIAEGMIE